MKLPKNGPLIQNETEYDGRTVNGIIRWVFKCLDLNGKQVMVKVKYHNGSHCYQGVFYSNVWSRTGDHVYNPRTGEYSYIQIKVPAGIQHLIIVRVAKPSRNIYPRMNHVYNRKDSPGTWNIGSWKEALVAITAHEAMHLRQYLTKPKARGRYNEIETEWAAFRLWRDWTEKAARIPSNG